jgi:hypothetical protein
MKINLIIQLLLIMVALTNCKQKNVSSNESYTISKNSLGGIKIGMTKKEIQNQFNNYQFGKAYNYEYDIDDEEEGILLIEKGDTLAYAWTKYGTDTIMGISCLSDKLLTKTGIHVGMEIAEIEKKYSDLIVVPSMYDENTEYMYLEKEEIELVFISHKGKTVGIYKNEKSLYDGTDMFDKTRKINRINLR